MTFWKRRSYLDIFFKSLVGWGSEEAVRGRTGKAQGTFRVLSYSAQRIHDIRHLSDSALFHAESEA